MEHRVGLLVFIYALLGSAGVAQQSSGHSAVVPPAVQEMDNTRNLPAGPIGPSDLVNISIYNAPEFTRTTRVSQEGNIRLPMLKREIKAEGLLPAQLEDAIAKELVNERILVDPFVTVTIAEYQSRPISVSGAVRNPIVLQASMPVTLIDAITDAGGLAPEAGATILITQPATDGRVKSEVKQVGVRALFEGNDPSANMLLSSGDEVRVPPARKVFVVGNVKTPGAYPLEDVDSATVLQMIALAQGLTQYYSNEAYIIRRDGTGTAQQITVPLKQILKRKAADVVLKGSDILYIPDNSGKRMTLGTLDKIATFGSTAGAAAIVYH